MSYRINTTNQPEGSDLVEVDDAEFIDLQRMGLIAKGKGDIDDDGKLKAKIAKEAPVEVATAVPGSLATPGAQAFAAPKEG